jgi:hypothetical protein
MKDEGCVFYRSFGCLPVLYVKGGRRVCVPPFPRSGCPSPYLQRHSAVSCLAVVSTRTSFHLLHAFTRCCGELRWHLASRVPSFTSLFPYLATKMSNLLLFTAMSLCYAYAYAYPPLCISTSVDYLSSGTIRQISFTARCLLAAYPGIQQMVLFSYLDPPLLQCHVHFANFAEFVRVVCDSLYTRGLAKLLFRVRQSRRMHNRPGRRWQVTRLCFPHI